MAQRKGADQRAAGEVKISISYAPKLCSCVLVRCPVVCTCGITTTTMQERFAVTKKKHDKNHVKKKPPAKINWQKISTPNCEKWNQQPFLMNTFITLFLLEISRINIPLLIYFLLQVILRFRKKYVCDHSRNVCLDTCFPFLKSNQNTHNKNDYSCVYLWNRSSIQHAFHFLVCRMRLRGILFACAEYSLTSKQNLDTDARFERTYFFSFSVQRNNDAFSRTVCSGQIPRFRPRLSFYC